MSDPMIFFTRDNGKLGLCLSYVGKWIAGILATLIGTGTIAFFALVYQAADNSRAALMEIRHLDDKLDTYKADTNERLNDLRGRIDLNDKRDFDAHGRGGK